MSGPKVSAVITTHNRPRLLEHALQSVLTQTYQNLEVQVIDDGSMDETRYVIERVAQARKGVYFWRHEVRRGLSAARNTGITKSTGEYIAFLDDDDEWKPDCVDKRIALLQELAPKQRRIMGVVYCGCEVHSPQEKRITYNMPRIQGNIMEYVRNHGLSTIPSTCLFPKKVLEDLGGFDESLPSSVDHDIWMNLATHGYYAFPVKQALVISFHTKQKKSMISDTRPRIQGVEQYLQKWAPTYEEWYGKDGAIRFIQRYRTKVLGDLGGKKITEGKFREARYIIRHVAARNRCSISGSALLMWFIGRNIGRMLIPGKIIQMMKKSARPQQ